jgi:hypothetical protein
VGTLGDGVDGVLAGAADEEVVVEPSFSTTTHISATIIGMAATTPAAITTATVTIIPSTVTPTTGTAAMLITGTSAETPSTATNRFLGISTPTVPGPRTLGHSVVVEAQAPSAA